MHLIKVSATNSTNSFAREMYRENPGIGPTCILAEKQLQGRGQRGTTWTSEKGKSLTFSIVYPRPNVSVGKQFLLSAAVATTIVQGLNKFNLPRLAVKWPNDIMAGNSKIGGLLIENVISEARITASVIGFGLNVNQEEFPGLPRAGSMKTAAGKSFDLSEVLILLLGNLESCLGTVSSEKEVEIMRAYKKHLFRYLVPSTFELPDGSHFTGIIADVTPEGKLLVRNEDERLQEFDLKEVKLCF